MDTKFIQALARPMPRHSIQFERSIHEHPVSIQELSRQFKTGLAKTRVLLKKHVFLGGGFMGFFGFYWAFLGFIGLFWVLLNFLIYSVMFHDKV